MTVTKTLFVLLAISGLVLLIACANLANLMLARASAREREVAVRLALGASRGRLIRQLLAESVLLAAAGAILGLLTARLLSQSLIAFLSTQADPLFVDLQPDAYLLAFNAGLAVCTCILFGLAPALRATRMRPGAIMKAGGRGLTAGREHFGLRRALVVMQVALSLVLLVGAFLFIRTLHNLLSVEAGFRATGVLVSELDFTGVNVPAARRIAFKQSLLEKVRAIPGVDSAALVSIVPISGDVWNQVVVLENQPRSVAFLSRVSPGYFRTLETPLLAGRDFDAHDNAAAPKVAIVNETFARKFFHGANPIGQLFRFQPNRGEPDPPYEIAGLVKDTKYASLREKPRPLAFLPAAQDDRPHPYARIVIRSRQPLSGLVAMVKSAAAQANPEITLDFRSFQAQIGESLLRERLMATLSGFFGGLAELLAMIGLYGVMSYSVARRTNEIGIRMALGADRWTIMRMVLGESGILLGIGLIVGTGLALAATKYAETIVFGLKPRDPATLALAAGALAVVAVAASYLPARRAARLEPMAALREE